MSNLTITDSHEEANCRRCGEDVGSVTGAGKRPRPGNVGLCVYCGLLSVFDEDLQLREPTPAERLTLQRSPAWGTIAAVMEKPPLAHLRGVKR